MNNNTTRKGWRHPNHKGIEKYWLRKAFDGMNLLPEEVLWRKKEAFSDGVSSKERSWFQVLQEYINENYDDELDKYKSILQENISTSPQSKEAKFYRKIYLSKFGLSKDDIIPHYWQPKWDSSGVITSYVDPSARQLEVYND